MSGLICLMQHRSFYRDHNSPASLPTWNTLAILKTLVSNQRTSIEANFLRSFDGWRVALVWRLKLIRSCSHLSAKIGFPQEFQFRSLVRDEVNGSVPSLYPSLHINVAVVRFSSTIPIYAPEVMPFRYRLP